MEVEYESHSLDRSSRKLKRQSTRRKNKPAVPDPAKSGSMEDITGTQVKELPVDFLVNFDILPSLTDQVMDIDIKRNGDSEQFHSAVEGKIIPSHETHLRLSGRRKKIEDFSNSVIEAHTDITLKVPPINTGACDGEESNEGIDWSSIQIPRLNVSCPPPGQRLSTDSGIAIQEINDRELSTHGNSTENSLTETSLRDHPSNNMLHRNFDSLKYGTKKARDSMLLLSQLCVVTVTLPADIQQGQKGRGAVLKFRFSPYTQIETLRVAILKVRAYVT